MTIDVPFSDTEVVQAFDNALNLPQEDHKGRVSFSGRYTTDRTNGLRLHKAISDIQAGNRKSFRILTLGDSLASTAWSSMNNQLARVLAGWLQSTPIYSNTIGALEAGPDVEDIVPRSAAQANPRHRTATLNNKLDYDVSFSGWSLAFDTGQYCTFSEGGNSVIGDRLLIPIVTSPGSGSVKIELSPNATPPAVGDASWRNVALGEITSGHTLTGSELIIDANAAFGVDMVELSVALGTWNIKVTHSAGGTVKMQPPMHEVTTAAAINNYRLSQSASNDFGNADATAVPVVAGIIAAYNPDVIVVESDDRLAAYQNFLPILESTLAAAGLSHQPLVLLVGNPFYDNTPYGDSDIAERIDYCWDFVHSRVGWDVIDGIAYSGGLEEAQAAGWSSDGIHYNSDIAWHVIRRWAIHQGVFPHVTDRPGGDASRSDVLTGTSRRLLTASSAVDMALVPVFDTATMTWAFNASGSASGVRNAASIRIQTGSTAGSGVSAFVNSSNTPMGLVQGLLKSDFRGFTTVAKAASTMPATYSGFIGARSEAFNSGYNGDLVGGTDHGVGFRFTNGIVQGVCIDGSNAFVTSAGSHTLVTGGAAYWVQLTCIITPKTVNNVVGHVEWLADGVSLGSSTVFHGNLRGIRAELSNTSAATNFSLDFLPPRVVTLPV